MLKLLIVIGKIHVQTKIKEFEKLSEHINNENLDRKISNFEIDFVMKSNTISRKHVY